MSLTQTQAKQGDIAAKKAASTPSPTKKSNDTSKASAILLANSTDGIAVMDELQDDIKKYHKL